MTTTPKSLRIGTAASWWGDRVDPARLIAETCDLDYLCFETMSEVTISSAQVTKRRNPSFPGYDSFLDQRMQAVLPGCLKRGTKITSNQGWINPTGAAERIVHWLRHFGAKGVKVAAISGSQITDRLYGMNTTLFENGKPTSSLGDSLVSAEAYLGAEPILKALQQGAQIVVSGRCADPALYLAPMMHSFGWKPTDYEMLGRGTGIGHLLECGPQITGGYFADPGFKDVPEPWNLGYPFAEVLSDGSAIIGKPDGTGGLISERTVKEQLLYEIHDPANYITPDVVVDLTGARISQVGADRVRVDGISGKPRTDTLKVSVGCLEGWAIEEMLFFAGEGALDRAMLSKRILEERFRIIDLKAQEVRFDLPGLNAIHQGIGPDLASEPYEVILRASVKTASLEEAQKVGSEFDAMGVNGPGMIGKRAPRLDRVREVVGVMSTLVPRDQVTPRIDYFVS
ncbi:MAG: acyclic terpene utilization AtuA family protein [Pseudomonadota bacterium]